MKELNDIILAYDNAVVENKKTALATVVQVEGSSYRRPGARMLVTEDGTITGAISGGCLEGDALRKARLVMYQQINKLEIYDTTNDEDNMFGVQLGCNGIVYILFEPIKNEDKNNPIQLLKKVALHREAAVLVTVFNQHKHAEQRGTSLFLNDNEVMALSDEQLKKEVQMILKQQVSAVKARQEHSVLYQFVPPAIQLLIVGAGNDAQPLMDMAALMGWNIVVVDGRPAYATQQRFPKADRIGVTKPVDILSAIKMDEHTAVVLITHNYKYDLAALERLIGTDCRYIGILGPKKKLHKMLEELSANGIAITDEVVNRIYGPVGLDIGAETSEEIALSIIAEIKAVFSHRRGTSLKDRQVEIHERSFIAPHD